MQIKDIIRYFVRSGSVLSLSASMVVIACSIMYRIPINFELLFIAFFLTFSSYYINRKTEIEQDRISHPDRTKFIEKNVVMDFLAIAALLVALFLSFERNIESFLLALIPPISVVLYSVEVHSKIKRFKDITWLKTTFVSLIWTVYAFLTATYSGIPISAEVYVMAVVIFVRIFIDCVIFDMRDIIADRLYNVRTLPIVLGEKNSIKLIQFMNIAVGVFIAIAAQVGWIPFFGHFLNLITIYGIFYIELTKSKYIDKHFLCDVIVDGEYILWPIVLMIGSIIFMS